MGGPGSGTWCRWSTQTTIDETKRIDIRYMRKHGLLKPQYCGSLNWNVGGKPTGNIDFESHPDKLILKYRFRYRGGDWEPVEQRIDLEFTPCHYGGQRSWFLCPRCNRRVAVLCGHDKLFLCRHCYKLPYRAQNEDWFGRMIRKRNKLKDLAFDDSGYRKRKGMHWTTFERLRNEYFQADYLCDAYIEAQLNSIDNNLSSLYARNAP